MKISNHKKIIISLAVFCIFYNIYSCAAIQAPSGGLKDITPPYLLYSIPESGSANFKGDRIELFFSIRVNYMRQLHAQIKSVDGTLSQTISNQIDFINIYTRT